MCDKHGDWTCEHLSFWEECGFPHNGSLSLNQIEKLSQKLGEVETGKRKKRDVGWKAFGMWKAEAIVRDNQKNKDRKGGEITTQCAKISTGKVDWDLDCPSGPPAPPPYVPSPQLLPRKAASLYPPLPAEMEDSTPVSSHTRGVRERRQFTFSLRWEQQMTAPMNCNSRFVWWKDCCQTLKICREILHSAGQRPP